MKDPITATGIAAAVAIDGRPAVAAAGSRALMSFRRYSRDQERRSSGLPGSAETPLAQLFGLAKSCARSRGTEGTKGAPEYTKGTDEGPPAGNRLILSALNTVNEADAKQGGAAQDDADDHHEEWTAAKWLADLGVAGSLAASLLHGVPDADDSERGLRFLQAIGKSAADDAEGRAAVRALLQQGGALDALAALLWPHLKKLGSVGTASSLQEKFVHDGVGSLSFSKLPRFYQGLHARIGAPNPSFMEAMEAEHSEQVDSDKSFKTSNCRGTFSNTRAADAATPIAPDTEHAVPATHVTECGADGIVTFSKLEWCFVTMPDLKLKWPKETDKVPMPRTPGRRNSKSGKSLWQGLFVAREVMPRKELISRMDEKNRLLKELGHPTLLLVEAFAARLYTGPMFVKYNAVMRGLEAGNDFLNQQMITLCCSKETSSQYEDGTLSFEKAKERMNTYTTTLNVLNSALLKLCKLTEVGTVYRGISGRKLSADFWKPDRFGARGGIEPAFMSTTLDREVAMGYAGSGQGFVFEMRQGMLSRGSDLSWLSQYPHEREILLTPLTGIEVRSVRVDGTVMVVCVDLNVNFASRSLEEVRGQMQHSHLQLLEYMSSALVHAGCPRPAIKPLDDLRLSRVAQDAEWFNSIQNFCAATADADASQKECMQLLGQIDKWQEGTEDMTTSTASRMRSAARMCEQTGHYRVAATLLKELCGSLGRTRSGSTRLAIKDNIKLAEMYWRYRVVDEGQKPHSEAIKTLDIARQLLNNLVSADLLILPESTTSVLNSPVFSHRAQELSDAQLLLREQGVRRLTSKDRTRTGGSSTESATAQQESSQEWSSASSLQEAITHTTHIDDVLMVAGVLSGLALTRLVHNESRAGDELILSLLREAMSLYEQVGATEKVAETLHSMGSLTQKQGKAEADPLEQAPLLQRAEEDFKRALELRQEALKQSELVSGGATRVEHLLALAQSHITLGNLYLDMGNELDSNKGEDDVLEDSVLQQQASLYQQATEQLQQARSVYTRATHPKHVKVAHAVEGLAKVCHRLGHLEESMGWYEQAISIYTANPDGALDKQMASAIKAHREIQAKLGPSHNWRSTLRSDTDAIRFILRAARNSAVGGTSK